MASSSAPATRRFTVGEVRRMVEAGVLAEDEPVELLDGELVIVSPEGPLHRYEKTRVRDKLLALYEGRAVVYLETPLVAGPDALPEPDLAVVPGTLEDHGCDEIEAARAWLVVEVAVTSLAEDRDKARIYARAGVPVYWLVDCKGGRLEQYTEPRRHGRYRVARVFRPDESIQAPHAGATLGVADLLPARRPTPKRRSRRS